MLKYCFIPLRQFEKVTWENFIQTKQDPSSIKERSHLARMKLFTCSCGIYLMIDNGRKRQRQEVVYQQKKLETIKKHILRRFSRYLNLLFNFSPLPNTRIKIIPLLLKKLTQICRGERTKLTVRFSIKISHSYHEIMNWGSLHIGTNGLGYTVFYVGLYFLCNLCNVPKYKLVFLFSVTCAMYLSIIKIHFNF